MGVTAVVSRPVRATARSLVWLAVSLVTAWGCDDGVTPDCPAMPVIDPATGELIGASRFEDGGAGQGGALNRWQIAAAAKGCATLPGGVGGQGLAGSAP